MNSFLVISAMHNSEIRAFHPADIPHLMNICLKTGNDGADGTALYSDPWFIGQLYVLPYVIRCPELCSVVLSSEIPVGYILGTGDTVNFYRWMEDEFLPPLRLRYPADMKCKSDIERFFLARMHADRTTVNVSAGYPAHLHINLLPEAQGQGQGTRLIDRFTGQLKEQSVSGVYLHTGADNRAAISFYGKQGFAQLETGPGSVKMGLKLDS